MPSPHLHTPSTTWQLIQWFIVNAVLPIGIPAIALATIEWFSTSAFPISTITTELIYQGFYIFSALSLILSVYEDFYAVQRCVGPIMQTVVVLLVVLTIGMFYLCQRESSDYIGSHMLQFSCVWLATALIAGVIKYRIINFNQSMGL